MKITPTTMVNIWTFDDETKSLKLLTLAHWSVGLKSEAAGYPVSATRIEPIVRKFLNTPDNYPLDAIVDHIVTSYEDIKKTLGGMEATV